MIVFAKDPVKFNDVMAEAIRIELQKSNLNREVKVEKIYEEGYKFGVKALGPRNYAKVKYQIEIGDEESYLVDPDVDLRIGYGDSKYNYRLMFTPAEERDKGIANKLFFTPQKKDIQNSKSQKIFKLSNESELQTSVFKHIMKEISPSDIQIYEKSE